jgi:ABC-2 type transport system ATP-binding protein
VITAQELTISYRVPVREDGLKAAFASLLKREYREVRAAQNISFELEAGEVVGFIGPNGAGKTSTLKILSGILHPSSGEATVLGFTPWRRERRFLKDIAMIRGSQPIGGPGELTVLDALRFQQLIYEVSIESFKKNLAELTELLKLEPLLNRQVRALSLGERMRASLALALIYHPRILFLDEPTIGLDVSGVSNMRRFIRDYCNQTRATALLTSHYMADVESLCKRIVLIDKGTIRYDGQLSNFATTLAPYKLLKIAINNQEQPDWQTYGEVIEVKENRATLRLHREQTLAITARLLAERSVIDLSVEDPPLENLIDKVYREGINQ